MYMNYIIYIINVYIYISANMWNVYMACSKALRVQHDRPQTIQGQPFEQGHLKPCWVGRLAFHCGRKLAVISTKNQLLAAMANWNQCCRLRRLWSFINQDLMVQSHEKRKHFLAVFSKTANESLATLSHSEKLSSNPLWFFDVFCWNLIRRPREKRSLSECCFQRWWLCNKPPEPLGRHDAKLCSVHESLTVDIDGRCMSQGLYLKFHRNSELQKKTEQRDCHKPKTRWKTRWNNVKWREVIWNTKERNGRKRSNLVERMAKMRKESERMGNNGKGWDRMEKNGKEWKKWEEIVKQKPVQNCVKLHHRQVADVG